MTPYQRSMGPLVGGYCRMCEKFNCFCDPWSCYCFNGALKYKLRGDFVDYVLHRLPMGPLVSNFCRVCMKYDCFCDPWSFYFFNNNNNNTLKYKPRVDLVDDILDRLPSDPFDMNIRCPDEIHTRIYYQRVDDRDGRVEAVLPTILDRFPSDPFGMSIIMKSTLPNSHGDSWELKDSTNDGEAGSPHDAMSLVLDYLGVTDLLSVEQVCRSLRDSVRDSPLLWWKIRIDPPLSMRITDSKLVKLTNRAQGFLQSLCLVNCPRITDSGLRCVLQSNLNLTELSVPGCTRLTVEGILLHLRALKSSGKPGIKHLQISGLPQVTDKHIEEFKVLLDADKYLQQRGQRPQFYHRWFSHSMHDYDRVIDIELCPICQKPTLVFDCPAESCQQKHHASQVCRGCITCIGRCSLCGKCIKDVDYVETFNLDVICLNCWNQPMRFPQHNWEKTTYNYNICLVG